MNGVDADPKEGAAGLERFSTGAGRHGDFDNIWSLMHKNKQ